MVHLCPPSALLSLYTVCILIFSVADPDPGSGAFLTLDLDPGSATPLILQQWLAAQQPLI
jgi:hypothetical protein